MSFYVIRSSRCACWIFTFKNDKISGIPQIVAYFPDTKLSLYHTIPTFSDPVRVLPGSVVQCLTRNPGVLGSSRTGSSGFFPGSVLGQGTLI